MEVLHLCMALCHFSFSIKAGVFVKGTCVCVLNPYTLVPLFVCHVSFCGLRLCHTMSLIFKDSFFSALERNYKP